MASRQEEKEKRRQERLAREQQEAAAAGRRKRLQYALGGLIALAVVAGIIVLAVVGLGSGSSSASGPKTASEVGATATLPKQATSDMNAAAKAASCTLASPAIEGNTHETKNFTAADYKTNPPTSGNHNPNWYQDGIYSPGDTPRLGMLVHPLEHGRIELQYKPGTPKKTVTELESLMAEQSNGYHMLLFQNTTGMKYAVAATAWGHSLTCPTMNDKVFDAIRTFRAKYIDKGPEIVP